MALVDASVLDRLRKIKSMKQSPFPAEAETAQRLLDIQLKKHGITEADLDPPRPPTYTSPPPRSPFSSWDKVWPDPPRPRPHTFHAPPPGIFRLYERYFAKRSKFTDQDLSFIDWETAERVSQDCEFSKNHFLSQMFKAHHDYGSLTRAQARGLLNVLCTRIRVLRDSMIPPTPGLCLICKAPAKGLCPECYEKALV